ncbi:hypothetical protein [Inquilinus sp.]|uniref:hypothetical protein n=1 Tax=Inquilinus sp. TaxID=1932117 RepID=UPI0031E460A6
MQVHRHGAEDAVQVDPAAAEHMGQDDPAQQQQEGDEEQDVDRGQPQRAEIEGGRLQRDQHDPRPTTTLARRVCRVMAKIPASTMKQN